MYEEQDGEKQHVIIGQEVGNPFDLNSIYPKVIAGNFDFESFKMRGKIESLLEPGVKIEVRKVLQDVLTLSADRTLTRIPH